ncbi:MAG: helix-turn-helix domain-containing protein [Spirochaetota bacterium]|nr:helix-turn-helix domain-containing protein [Spirochaetota bacterium]
MESIGEKLKAAREEKGYSADQVARDTNIARRFILAMEGEDFDAFPGDTYLIGFLRNYADYLGLDPERIISLYRNMKIQEQPIPMDELIRGRRKTPSLKLVLFICVGLLVIAGAGFGVYSYMQRAPEAEPAVAEEVPAESSAESSSDDTYEMDQEIVARRFRSGQSIIIHMSEGKVPLSIKEIGETVALTSPDGLREIGLGQSVSFDLTLDGVDDLLVEVQDIDSRGGTAVIRFDRGVGRTGEVAAESGEAEGGVLTAAAESAGGGGEEPVEYNETPVPPERTRSSTVITTSDSAEPFRLSVVFRGYSLVRYLKDNDIREQRYFNKDDTFQLDVNREVMLWISNAGTFKAQIAGRDITVGQPGEVAARLIRWEKADDSDQYQLKMIPVY